MKPTSSALNAVLALPNKFVVDAFQFTLIDGTILRYCGGDQNITDQSGNVYLCGIPNGPFFQKDQKRNGNRGLCKWKIGVEVDTLQFDVIPGNAMIEGFTFLQACKLGIFDGAECIMYRAFMPTYGDTSAGLVNIFTGRVVEIDCGRSMATFNINSHLELLSQQLPRELYQPACLNTLFDQGCTLSSSSFSVSETVTSATVSVINATMAQATDYFTLGTVKFTSGNNSGFKRTIKAYTTGGSITLLVPLPFVPLAGDTFTAVPGCDKKQSTCTNKFSNLVNFRGQPFIPAPETGV